VEGRNTGRKREREGERMSSSVYSVFACGTLVWCVRAYIAQSFALLPQFWGWG
jgi:hypothetical protein